MFWAQTRTRNSSRVLPPFPLCPCVSHAVDGRNIRSAGETNEEPLPPRCNVQGWCRGSANGGNYPKHPPQNLHTKEHCIGGRGAGWEPYVLPTLRIFLPSTVPLARVLPPLKVREPSGGATAPVSSDPGWGHNMMSYPSSDPKGNALPF